MKIAQALSALLLSIPLLAAPRESPAASIRRLTSNVASESGSGILVFAAVGSTAGGGGTFFRSSVTLFNNRDAPQSMRAAFFPGGCDAVRVVDIFLQPFARVTFEDFVAEVFNTSGLGGAIVIGIDDEINPDPGANIDGFSRIYTAIPGFRGTASQSFSPLVVNADYGFIQRAFGLRHDADFRTNIVLFNTEEFARRFNAGAVGDLDSREFTVNVGACQAVILGIPAATYGNLTLFAAPEDQLGNWYGYGSTVDNASQDAWSVPMRP